MNSVILATAAIFSMPSISQVLKCRYTLDAAKTQEWRLILIKIKTFCIKENSLLLQMLLPMNFIRTLV